jgi:integrase
MPQITGEGYVSNKVNKAGTYYMFLVIDGQKIRKSAETKDLDEAIDKLNEWKAQVKVGVVHTDSRLRYEGIRDNYLGSGKHVQESTLRDLNQFFKNVYVTAITPTKIKKFREWRESLPQVVEYKEETFQKEFALRKLKAQNGHQKKLSPSQIANIEAEARQWVENGVKATTNRRLTVLRAMFNHAAKEELIRTADVPASFCLWEGVDNVKTNKFTEEQFNAILKELSSSLHPFVVFMYNTGMRSGQVQDLTWDMIDENDFLVVPGKYTKNGAPFPLPLVDENGKPYDWTAAILKIKVRPHGMPIFDTTNFRDEWRRACHKLKLGIFNEETRAYRGAEPHDFRRTAVSNMNANGIAETDAMIISGHKTNSMFKRYGITNPRQAQNVFNTMRKSRVAS